MTNLTEEPPATMDTPQENTGPPPTTTQKRERTEAQRQALEKARVKAMVVRQENAALKRKEHEVQKALLEKTKAERYARVTEQYEALTKEEHDEPQPTREESTEEEPTGAPPVKRKRKPARRVVVTEVSSESEVSDVEVVIPKARKAAPTPQELAYQRTVEKMFSFG